jgi:hypothetical protein
VYDGRLVYWTEVCLYITVATVFWRCFNGLETARSRYVGHSYTVASLLVSI